jgi:hypothetical protein
MSNLKAAMSPSALAALCFMALIVMVLLGGVCCCAGFGFYRSGLPTIAIFLPTVWPDCGHFCIFDIVLRYFLNE